MISSTYFWYKTAIISSPKIMFWPFWHFGIQAFDFITVNLSFFPPKGWQKRKEDKEKDLNTPTKSENETV